MAEAATNTPGSPADAGKIPSVKMWKAKNKKLNPIELEYEGELTENKFEAFLLAKTKYELTEVKVDASVGDL